MDRSLEEVFARYRPEVDAELRSCFPEASPATDLYGMLQYHLGWLDQALRPATGGGGKMLRPTLCLLACEAVGGDYHAALPAAAALELLHNFSLIHDDIQDRSDERRHRPTVWKLWGEAQAINAGDAMFTLAQLALLRLTRPGLPPSAALTAARLFNSACLRLTEGQQMDLSFESRLDVTAEEYVKMVSGKTAALIGCSLALGALLGSQSAPLADQYRRIGEELGLAFQIQDDILGIWGDEARTGKPTVSDLYQRKKTLPVIYALERVEGAEKAELSAIYRDQEVLPAQAANIAAILDRLGARAHATELAREHLRTAMGNLARLGPREPAASALWVLAEFLTTRDY